MDNFFREIEEDLRRERQLALWRKYGVWAVSLALVVVIAVAAVVGWRQYQENRRASAGLEYQAAVAHVTAGRTEEALGIFRTLGEGAPAGYAGLARLQEAAVLARQGDDAAAAELYDRMSRDQRVDRVFRDLALILYAFAVADAADPAQLAERLVPLTAAGNPWRHSALEMSALLATRRGDIDEAREIYRRLAEDQGAPNTLRSRAAEFLAVLGD